MEPATKRGFPGVRADQRRRLAEPSRAAARFISWTHDPFRSRLRYRRGAERVRFDNVRACREIFIVNCDDHIGSREHEKIVCCP